MKRSLESLREGDGLTPEALGALEHKELRRLLGTGDDTTAGVKVLVELARKVEGKPKGRPGKAIRNALAIDVPRLKNATARRTTWEAELVISTSARWRYERVGVQQLTAMVLERASNLHSEQPDVFVSLSKEPAPILSSDVEQNEHPPEDESSDPRWRAVIIDVFQASPIMSMIILILTGMLIFSGVESIPFMKDDRVADALKERYAHLDAKPTGEPGYFIGSKISTPASKDMSNGWGPERPTFTTKNPAPYPVFNSITDEPGYGDQRNFVTCRASDDSPYKTEVQAYDGQIYQCRLWFENAVAPNLDSGNPAAKLHDARARIRLPEKNSKDAALVGYLSAVNSITVWSSCRFISDRAVTLTYERDTTQYEYGYRDETRVAEKYNGETMASGIATTKGIQLGVEKSRGVVGQDGLYVSFNVRVSLE